MKSSPYEIDYAGRFRFPARPDVVWSAMEQVEQFEGWWSWLGSLSLEGDGLRTGSALVGLVSPPLPYRMRVRVELDRCIPGRLVEATVHGDLEGPARLSLAPDGDGTVIDARWRVEMMQRRMRAAARVAHPLLRRGHDMVVEATVRGFWLRARGFSGAS